MSINQRIIEIRQNSKMNKSEFARAIKMDNSRLGKIEKGEATPSLNEVIKISEIFNVSADYILKGTEQPKETTIVKDQEIEYNPNHSFGQKLERFLDSKGLTITEFANSIEWSRGSIHNYLSGSSNPSYEFLIAFSQKYPEIDLDFFLRPISMKPSMKHIQNTLNELGEYVEFAHGIFDKIQRTTIELKEKLKS